MNQERDWAPRFLLHPGDLLCLDNYRVFHGRETYSGFDRLLHKLWAWSEWSFGIPDRDGPAGRDRQITIMEESR